MVLGINNWLMLFHEMVNIERKLLCEELEFLKNIQADGIGWIL